MRLTVVGCDGSWPGVGGTGSCYLVSHDGFNLVVDLGGGALGALQRHIDMADIGAIAVTHGHTDHYADLFPLSIALYWGSMGPKDIPLLVPEGFFGLIDGSLVHGTREAWEGAFAMSELTATSRTTLGPFVVEALAVPHLGGAVGLRVQAGGRVLAYSGDAGPGEEVEELARGAHLFLCEATYLDGHERPYHLTARQAAAYATSAGVDRLVLTHLEPGTDPAASLAQASSSFSGDTQVAAPGLSLEI